jgi:hypothetical protein
MKVLIGCLTLFALVASAAPSDALSLFKKRRCLPRAIDSPIIRPKVKEYHKPGKHQQHPKSCSLTLASEVRSA